MILSVENIKELSKNRKLDYLLFWGSTPKSPDVIDESCLSQWYPSEFVIDGIKYPTAEHWMMASKARMFEDHETLELILSTPDPRTAKKLGRSVKNFNETVWRFNSTKIVIKGNEAKFTQNEKLRLYLESTMNTILVEASPYDKIWGIGLSKDDPNATDPNHWRGENLLGFCLMDVRYWLTVEYLRSAL